MKLGAQLYTVREFCKTQKQLIDSLNRVREIGYSCVQLSGVGNYNAKEIKAVCDRLGLEIALTHTAPDRILGDTQAVIAEHKDMGCKYVGLGSMPKNYRSFSKLPEFYQNFKRAVNEITQSGLTFVYHNHAFEFEKQGPKTMLENLIELFGSAEIGIVLDTYWVHYAGANVLKWIDKLAGRLDCIHLKDMGITKGDKVMKPVLSGNMDFDSIIPALQKAGTKYALVEQDTCECDPFEALKISFDNLQKYDWE